MEFNGIHFDEVPRAELLKKIEKEAQASREKVLQICQNPDSATFENTMARLEEALNPFTYWVSMFFNLHSADCDDVLKEQAGDVSRIATEFSSFLYFNKDLFSRIKALAEHSEALTTSEEKALIQHYLREFENNGANLSESDQETLKQLDLKIGEAKVAFRQNVLEAMNQFQLWITDEADLKGLPEDFKTSLKNLAKEHGRPGEWLVTLHPPFYVPFMTYSAHRHLREKLYRAHLSKGLHEPYDNRGICYQVATLRRQRAQLLGYETYADLQLQRRMAKTPSAVYDLLNQLLSAALPQARQELKALLALAEDEIEGPLRSWDYNYYEEKLKNARHQISEEDIKPYFESQQTLEGFFNLVSQLYGLSWEEVKDAKVYHDDVRLYKISAQADGQLMGYLYVDLFSRPNKSGGAWMTTFLQQGTKDLEGRPVVSIVCNFPPATADQPSLLTFNDALTLFHEGGHAFHEMLSQCKYATLSGTNTYLDFVELPSQFMENWLYESEVLQPWARHYKTGEPIPKKYLSVLKEMKVFMEGLQTVRQIGFGLLDMSWHHTFSEASEKDIFEFEKQATEAARVFPWVEGTCLSTSFSHLFAGGYAAGYYGYKWAEVLDADAFSAFQEEGLFNPQTGARYRKEILEKGGTEDPAVLFENFRGRPPSPEPLMERSGFQGGVR